jgi:prepilin-type processing-associated H-X9-DG protein
MFDELDERGIPLFAGRPTPGPSRFGWLSWVWFWPLGLLILFALLPMLHSRHHGNGRRLQCLSNIRQMGLGIAGYQVQTGYYPPGTIPNPDFPIERRLGWGVTILPYIDQVEYLNERGKSPDEAARLAWDDPVFAGLIDDRPGITRCPESLTVPPSGFLAIAGLGTDAPSLPTNHRRAGIFGDDRKVCPADVKDGTSVTMMLTESDSLTGPWFAGGRRTVRGLDPFHQPYIGPARQFGGNHSGGANVLFADGSAKFVRDSVDPKVFEAMSTIAGGEKVSDDWDN